MLNTLTKALSEAEKGGFQVDRDKLHIGALLDNNGYYSIIFRQDFMKALFGEGEHYENLYAAARTAAENSDE
jgi:hypothetical protein